jgi:protein SCO1
MPTAYSLGRRRAPGTLGRLVVRALIALGVVAVAATVVVALAVSDDNPPQSGDAFEGALLPAGFRAPDFDLRDQDGRAIRMRELRGRPAIVTFLYTHCDETCPAQAQQVKGALNELGHDVPALAIAVDPPRDTAESARHFLLEQRMTGRMDFVLGSRDQLRPVWKGYAIQPQTAREEHQARIVLVDKRGFQRIGFPLGQTTPERLAHDVRLLERE